MTDILVDDGKCTGMAAETKEGETLHIHADNTIMATGGIGVFMSIPPISQY